MNIRSIDVIVHPNFYQMTVPYLPLHKRQLELVSIWDRRFNELADQEDTILIYLSFLSDEKLSNGLNDVKMLDNKVEQDEILTIRKLQAVLSKRLIVYGWTLVISEESIVGALKSRGFSYVSEDVNISVYGEVLEVCVASWASYLACILRIPEYNIHIDPIESLSNQECTMIDKWRYDIFCQK